LVVTYSETDSEQFNDASVHNVRKLDFQGESLQSFCRRKKAALLWRLGFRMGSFTKDCLQLLVKRISNKTLEKYLPSYI